MKTKFVFLALVLPFLASCGNSKEYIYTDYECYNETQHVKYCKNCEEDDPLYQVFENHKYDEGHLGIAPTHTSSGEMIYTCRVCGYEKSEEVEAISEHVYNRRIISDEYLASTATCANKARYYYSCECGKKGSKTFEAGPTLNHKLIRVEILEDNSKKDYAAFERYNPEGLKLQYVCSECGFNEVDLSEVVFEYESGKTSFRYGETKIVGHYQDLSFELNGFNISKARNEIYGIEDMKVSCHASLDLSNVGSKYGEVTYSVEDKNGRTLLDYEYEALKEEGSPYTLTASASSGDDYLEHSVSVTIEVEHNFVYDAIERATCCTCGQKLLDGYFFNMETNQLDLSHLSGLYKDKFNPNDVKVYTTGKALNWSEAKVGVAVDLVTTIDGELIHFNGLKVDKILTTIEDIQATCLVTSVNNAANPLGTPYCVIPEDIDCNNYVYEGGFFAWDGSIYNGNGYCFRGTLDGRGHSISNLSLGGYGIFGYLGAFGECKDISFKDISPITEGVPCAITYYAYMSKFTNVTMSFASYLNMADNSVLAKSGNIVGFRPEGGANNATFVRFDNILIDASGLDIGAITSNFGNGSEAPSYTNYIVKCRSYKTIGMSLAELPEGVRVYIC